MSESIIANAADFIQTGRFQEAGEILGSAVKSTPDNGNLWHLLGQCFRFQNRLQQAVHCHLRADQLMPDSPPILLALGVAQQLSGDLESARDTLIKAHNLDTQNAVVLNSLGMTFKLLARLEDADQAYVGGLRAHSKKIVSQFRNVRTNSVVGYDDITHNLWMEYALFGATFLASSMQGISSLALPDAEFAIRESRLREHDGLLWMIQDSGNERVMFILPNFLDTFRNCLYGDSLYSNLLGNRGTILRMMGDLELAEQHLAEADFFQQS